MSKTKKRLLIKKRADRETKRNAKAPHENPFEIHRNKVKHNVIGRRIAKCESGNRLNARSKAVKLRNSTLLCEYITRNKSGKGVDDRREMSGLGGAMLRKDNSRTSNELNDYEKVILTHKGRKLSDYDDDRLIDDDEDDDINLFERAEFIETAHFGGGDYGPPKSANDVLNEIMNEKREKRAEKEANDELTLKLDNDWGSIRNLLKHKNVEHEMHDQSDDYDILVKQLMFENNSPEQRSKIPIVVKDTQIDDRSEETLKKTDDDETIKEKNEHIIVVTHGIAPKNRKLPFMLPLYEPKFDDSLRTPLSEKKKLMKKYKREFKGAQRELRKDATFMRKVWIDETLKKDAERKRKVKELFADISIERHMYKKKK